MTRKKDQHRFDGATFPPESRAKLKPGFFLVWAMIVLVGVGIAALTFYKPSKAGEATISPAPVVAATPPNIPGFPGIPGRPEPLGTQPAVDGQTPAPWQYDAVNNQYWDATTGHNHWHPGEPPKPWEYDEASNYHFHAGHGHWHEGPPPPLDQRGQ